MSVIVWCFFMCCLWVLFYSLYLFKLGLAPQIQDLYGKVDFTGKTEHECVPVNPLNPELMSPCCSDEHELRHLGPSDDEHPASLQLPGLHESSASGPSLRPLVLRRSSVAVRLLLFVTCMKEPSEK